MVAERNPQIEQAVVKLRRLSADERARDLYERREKARRDQASLLKFELEKGMKKGKLEGKREVAQIALNDNVPPEFIAKLTGLSLKEIERLAAELKH